MTDTNEQHGKFDTGYPHSLRPELHKALIARGIEYWLAQGITFWNRDDGCECLAYGYKSNGVPRLAIKVVGFTDPEQAIAATLGAGTCKRVLYKPTGVYVCSECGLGLSKKLDKYCFLRYCPNCGRRIEVS